MQAIRFEKVGFSYQAEQDELFSDSATFSLDGLDFSVEEGEFVAVLGHNGSGKSTLARLTNGLLSPNSGKITVLGLDATDEKNLFEIRKQVGIVFQNPDNQTVASIVEDDIAFGPENIGVEREEIGRRIEFALGAVGMSEYRHSTTSRLSGGQKQRIAIAGVLALKPKIMILDESTAMLDPRGRKEVMDVVLRLNREEKITVLLITHFPEEALLADRAVVMNHGKIVLSGKPSEVLAEEETLKKCSLTLPRPLQICRKLQSNGVAVEDCFDADALASALAPMLQNTATENTSEQVENITETGEIGSVYCENLSYTYNPSSPFATHALNGVDLQIHAGDFFGIIGHTGSGKSTFVQHLNALIKLPTAEKKYKPKKRKKNAVETNTKLQVNGLDLTQKTTDFKLLRKKVGMVFQYPEYQLFAETVFEDVAFGLKNFNENLTEEEIESAVKEAIERVGLNYEEVKNRSPFELSGGQKRRVAIAGVIVTKPEILVLDEPAAGLDPLGKEEIMSLLHTMHQSWCKTVIIVSHDMDEIAENCNRAVVFSGGKVLVQATPKRLFEKDEWTKQAGLDLPFTAKVMRALKGHGVRMDGDLTVEKFVEDLLKNIKTSGAGTSLEQGGQSNA
ncbi:MAG: energy-coupling factor transporter ATPase [Clostridia bacterium]|nr:energy-coupling factor transporter ATPase [Clostridia bacterium]